VQHFSAGEGRHSWTFLPLKPRRWSTAFYLACLWRNFSIIA
jgi:hypothetical protein